MKFILSVSFSFLWLGVQAQCDLVLSGRVVDEHDRTPLDFASVELVGTGRGVQAGADGYFRMEGLCPGPTHYVWATLGAIPWSGA